MKIYVSGTFTAQKRLRILAAKLWDLGHEITGSWLHETTKPPALSHEQWLRRLGEKDTAEVMASDCLVLDLFGDSTTGGRYTELGIALHPRDRKLIYTVGPRSKGCFPALADMHFDSWSALIKYVKEAHK